MKSEGITKHIAKVLLPLVVITGAITTAPITSALFTSSEGGTIAFSVPCVSSLGPGFWTLKTNSSTPIVYLYPNRTMRNNYLAPNIGVTTLGLIGTFIDCTTPTFPPVTLVGRLSTLYGTAFGF